MLSWFRKHSKSWVVKAFYVTVAVTFFGGFGILSVNWWKEKPAEESSQAVAVANGDPISARDFSRSYDQAKQSWFQRMKRMYGEVPEEMLDTGALKQDVLDEMVGQALLSQEAKKLGIKVSKAEINIEIGKIPYFQDQTGAFNQTTYKNMLNRLQVTPEQFEAEVKQQLLVSRVVNVIVAPVQVSADEVKEYYGKTYEELNLEYFALDAEGRYGELDPTGKEIEDYYKSHPKDFDWPETRAIHYFIFPIAGFEKNVPVSDAELKEYYDQSKDRYQTKPAQAHFRHILIKAAEDAPEADVKKAKEQAEKVAGELLGGADFAETAKKFSEDNSAEQGGDLGWASRGSFVPAFEQAGYALPVGEFSTPVRTQFGFHIIKLEGMKPAEYQPLEQVKELIQKDMVRIKAHLAAQDKAAEVLKDCLGKGMVDAAKKYGLELKTSEVFKKAENGLEGIPDSRNITEEAFYMNQGEISEVFSGVDDLYIYEVTEVKDPHAATLEEARPKVIRKLRPEIRLAKAKEDGRKDLSELGKNAEISAMSKKENAPLKETDFFQRGSKTVPGIGSSDDLTKLVFNLTMTKPVPQDVYATTGRVYVFRLKAVKAADLAKFEKDRDEVKQALLLKKQQETFDRYLENLKKGKVEIKDDIFKQIN